MSDGHIVAFDFALASYQGIKEIPWMVMGTGKGTHDKPSGWCWTVFLKGLFNTEGAFYTVEKDRN